MKERLVGAAVLVALGIVLIPLLLDGRAPPPADTRVGLTLPGQKPRTSTHTIEINRDAAKPAGPSRAVGQSASSGRVTRNGEPSEPNSTPDKGESAARTAPGKLASSSTGGTEAKPAGTAAQPSAAPATQPASKPVSSPAPTPTPKPAPRKVEKATPKPTPAAAASPAAASPAAGEWAVQVGSFGSRENAERLRGQLASEGFPVFVTQIESRGRTFHRVRVGPATDRAGADALLRKLGASAPGAKVVRNLP